MVGVGRPDAQASAWDALDELPDGEDGANQDDDERARWADEHGAAVAGLSDEELP